MLSKTIAGGVELVFAQRDVRGRMKSLGLKPQNRLADGVYRVYVHHSGALGRPGLEGALAAVDHVLVRRGFRMPSYHFWIPRAEVTPGTVTVYQMAPVEWHCWHTGAAAGRKARGTTPNIHGVGVALQGNTTRSPMSDHQVEALEALLPYLRHEVLAPAPDGEDWLSWHSEANRWGGRRKAACPGKHATEWLKAYREAAR